MTIEYLIYLVEDDIQLNLVLSTYLKKEGWQVKSFYNGEDALAEIEKKPHLWILDVNLPGINGYQLIKAIKAKYPRLPTIFISSYSTSLERIAGLEMGSDDYLPKPFLARELVIRVRKLLERIYENEPAEKGDSSRRLFLVPPYWIDFSARTVVYGKKNINLSTKEFDLLFLFVSNRGVLLSREQIIEYIWGKDYEGSDRTVDSTVKRLRRKMPALPIETNYGFGYKLLLPPKPVLNSK